jgi:hypothetical protein
MWLEKRSKAGDSAAKLNTIKYTTVLTSWINRKKWKAATALFEKMTQDFLIGNKDAVPDHSTFQKIVEGLCVTSMVNEADCLIRTMWKVPLRESEGDVYNCAPVIKAWAHAGCPDRAAILLGDMLRLHQTGRLKAPPPKHLFRLMVGVWEKSKAHDREACIQGLERQMSVLFPRVGIQPKSKGWNTTQGRRN